MNKEETAAYKKKWYLENKERIAERKKAWRLENKEKLTEQKKIDYLLNKEKRAAQMRAWEKANPEKKAAYNKKYLLKLNLLNKKISQRTLTAWSLQVKDRDGLCLCCSATDNLHAHHILPKAKFPHHALLTDNGITLCEPCHIKEHSFDNLTYPTYLYGEN
jgi:hypothetical protein